jgi:redox-sensitive bicupin YhaK (pirin superfamily)
MLHRMTSPSIEIVIEPRTRDLGGFTVGRVLPFAKRRMVGPFIFFDEMGPADFAPGSGIDVRPHPHIGLATVTYLFDGEIRHHDSLGFDQVIRPGDVNWMTAGRGIVHSERTDDARRKSGQKMHGIQSWVALPEHALEVAPAFHHHPKATLPVISKDGCDMRLIAGAAFGATSPVKTFSPMFYLGVEAAAGAMIAVPGDYEERAIYILDGEAAIDGEPYGRGKMIVFTPGAAPNIKARTAVRAMLLGGESPGARIIWWNLVSTTRERIDAAKRDWLASADAGFKDSVFRLPPGEEEFIPLPED